MNKHGSANVHHSDFLSVWYKFVGFGLVAMKVKFSHRIRLARKLREIYHIENGKTFSTEFVIKHSYFLRKYW